MVLENLDNVLGNKTLADLETPVANAVSNLIEPTAVEIDLILLALKDGKDYKYIRKNIRRTVGNAKLGFSYEQIDEINKARLRKIAELKPVAVGV